MTAAKQNSKHPHRRLIVILISVVCGMIGFSFALVPLYNTFCNIAGIQVKVDNQRTRITGYETKDMDRLIKVEFVSHVTNIPWDFKPNVNKVYVHPGELKRVTFYAENHASNSIIGQAIPSITPGPAALYFKKTECFCFNQQYLGKGESAEMPLVFYIDKNLPKEINELTLSYTLFDAKRHDSVVSLAKSV